MVKRVDNKQVIVLDKVVGSLLLVNLVFSVGGNYVLTNYRLTESEKAIEKQDARITLLESDGHNGQEQERRITKLETRADLAGVSISDLTTNMATVAGKLDTALKILERVDRQTNGDSKGKE